MHTIDQSKKKQRSGRAGKQTRSGRRPGKSLCRVKNATLTRGQTYQEVESVGVLEIDRLRDVDHKQFRLVPQQIVLAGRTKGERSKGKPIVSQHAKREN